MIKSSLLRPFKSLEDLNADKDLIEDVKDKGESVCLNIPLLLRLLEYAKEDAKEDVQLHYVVENVTKLYSEGNPLTMDDYDKIVAVPEVSKEDNDEED